MSANKIVALCCLAAAGMLGGCTVITVASTAVSVAGTAVGVGLSVGSAAVGATASVAKGAVNLATGSSDEAEKE